jgi:hypothetical protein
VTIHLSLSLVRQLSIEAMEAFKSVPRRGLEIGGLLLGHHGLHDGRLILMVENFAPVESEHRSGPSYMLSETDRRNFAEALDAHPGVLGMFRTQTRGDSLTPQQDDIETFEHYFADPEALFLLIHPGQLKAAFFRRDVQGMTLLHELPFRASDLPGSDAPASHVAERPVVSSPPTVLSPVELAPAVSATIGRPVSKWLVGSLAVLLGGVAGALVVRHAHSELPTVAVAPPQKSVPPAVEPQSRDHINLSVQTDGSALRLVWDQHASAIRNADRAILEITDGNHLSKLNLGSRELGSGMVSYWPETKDVSFRLQVLGNGHQTDDSIRAVGGQLAPLPAVPVEAASKPAEPAKPVTLAKAPVVQAPPPPVVNLAPAPTQGEASRAATQEPRPSPFVAPTQPVAETKPPVATPPHPATLAPRELEPVVSVEAEPVSGSRVSRVVSHIPLLKRLRKPVQPFVPPTPLHEAKPHLSARDRADITGSVVVSVRVYVTKEGKVDFAEVESGARHRTELANAAIYAARHWDFTPAHMGEERVPGEVILHFRFAPPEPPRLAAQGR